MVEGAVRIVEGVVPGCGYGAASTATVMELAAMSKEPVMMMRRIRWWRVMLFLHRNRCANAGETLAVVSFSAVILGC